MGSGGPLQVAHLPPPTTTAACLQVPINHNQSKETRPQDLTPSPSRRAGTGEHRQPPNRWAIPEYRSGPYRLVKSSEYIIYLEEHEVACPAGSFVYIPAGTRH